MVDIELLPGVSSTQLQFGFTSQRGSHYNSWSLSAACEAPSTDSRYGMTDNSYRLDTESGSGSWQRRTISVSEGDALSVVGTLRGYYPVASLSRQYYGFVVRVVNNNQVLGYSAGQCLITDRNKSTSVRQFIHDIRVGELPDDVEGTVERSGSELGRYRVISPQLFEQIGGKRVLKVRYESVQHLTYLEAQSLVGRGYSIESVPDTTPLFSGRPYPPDVVERIRLVGTTTPVLPKRDEVIDRRLSWRDLGLNRDVPAGVPYTGRPLAPSYNPRRSWPGVVW